MVEVSRDGRRIYFTNLSTVPSMTNSIPMGSRAGWSRSTPSQRAGSYLTKTSSCPGLMATSRIKCACKAETRPRIPIAIHDTEAAELANSASSFQLHDGDLALDKIGFADEVTLK